VTLDDQVLDPEQFMVFCFLSRTVSYRSVLKTFNLLKAHGLTTRQGLKGSSQEQVHRLLKRSGYRFHNKMAECLMEWSMNTIVLASATREELCEIKGIGMKLSSMFLNRTRGEQHLILDVHIKRWLKRQGLLGKNYLESEKNFRMEAERRGVTPVQLDYAIWETYRK